MGETGQWPDISLVKHQAPSTKHQVPNSKYPPPLMNRAVSNGTLVQAVVDTGFNIEISTEQSNAELWELNRNQNQYLQ